MGNVPSCDPAGIWSQKRGMSQGRGQEGSMSHAGAALSAGGRLVAWGVGERSTIQSNSNQNEGGDSLSHLEKTEVPTHPKGAPAAGPPASGGAERTPAPSREGTRSWTSCSPSHSVGQMCFLLRRAQSLPLEEVGVCSFICVYRMFQAQGCRGRTYTCPRQGHTGREGRPQQVGEMQDRTQSTGSEVGVGGGRGCFWRAGLSRTA